MDARHRELLKEAVEALGEQAVSRLTGIPPDLVPAVLDGTEAIGEYDLVRLCAELDRAPADYGL